MTRRLRAAALVVLLAACARAPVPTLAVRPRACAPGEPLEVTLAPEPGAAGGTVVLEVRDAAGETLARRQVELGEGPTAVWVDPAVPTEPGDLRVEARPPGRLRAGASTGARVPLDLFRPVARPRPEPLDDPEPHPEEGAFRWAGSCTTMTVEDLGDDALLSLRYRCGPEAPRGAWLRAGAAAVPLDCGEDRFTTARVPLPRAAWGSSAFLPVEIVVDPAFRPAELWAGSEDVRELGLQVVSAVVTLADGQPPALPSRK